jgi:hypothetical protein
LTVESWLALREERRLRVFENRVLRRIVGPKRGKVTREWRKLQLRSLTICNLHQISRTSNREERWEGHVACTGKRRCVYRFLVGKPEG